MSGGATPIHASASIPVRLLALCLLAAPLVAVAPLALLPAALAPDPWLIVAAVMAANLALVMGIGLTPIRKACAGAQRKLAALFNATPEGVLEVARDGTILFVNAQLCRDFGYTSEELIGQSVEVLVPADARARHVGKRDGFLASARARSIGSGIEVCGVRKDGTRIPLDVSLTCIEGRRSGVTYCLVRDISANKAYEDRLLEANRELLASVAQLERNTLELRQLAEMGELLHSSFTEEELFGVFAHAMQQLFPRITGGVYVLRDGMDTTAEAVVTWGDLESSLRPVISQQDCRALERGRTHGTLDERAEPHCRHQCDEAGRPGRCVPLMGHGELLGVMHLYAAVDTPPRELTEGARAQIIQAAANQVALSVANLRLRETLRDQSLLDPLTGLYNRRAVHQWFEHEVRGAARNGRPLSALLIDIDHFKRFNDQYGHECGDAALRHMAGVLRNGLRGEDLVCRLGGEEFAVLLPETPMGAALNVAEKLRAAAERLTIHHGGQAIGPLTISVGVAVLRVDTECTEELLRHADRALYRAKAGGRNRVQASNELDCSGIYLRPPPPKSQPA